MPSEVFIYDDDTHNTNRMPYRDNETLQTLLPRRLARKRHEADIKPDAQLFHVTPEPGTIVKDSVARRAYEIAADGTPGREYSAIRRAAKVRDVRNQQSRRRVYPWVIILSSGILFTICVVFFSLRHRRHSSGARS